MLALILTVLVFALRVLAKGGHGGGHSSHGSGGGGAVL